MEEFVGAYQAIDCLSNIQLSCDLNEVLAEDRQKMGCRINGRPYYEREKEFVSNDGSRLPLYLRFI